MKHFQVDERATPWVAYADEEVALVASTLPSTHDAGHRRTVELLRRFKAEVLGEAGVRCRHIGEALIDDLNRTFAGALDLKDWGLHLGVAVATDGRWRVWTAGLVCCGVWAPGLWTWLTSPQSLARQLTEQGMEDTTSIGEGVAVNVARPGMSVRALESADVPRTTGSSIVLLGSVAAGRILERAAHDTGRHSESVDQVLRSRPTRPPGIPTTTYALLTQP